MNCNNSEQQLWSGHLGAPSYYVGTAGNVSAEAIKNYIKEAKTSNRDPLLK